MSWIEDRPVTYNPDNFYDEINQQWTSTSEIDTAGKIKETLICIAYGEIYFGEL